MSATLIFDTAPLGSLIRFSNGKPRPPDRFTRKLRAWAHDNGTGRLVERRASCARQGYTAPASFALHLGDFGGPGGIAIVVRRHYELTSKLNFEIERLPAPRMVRILTAYGDHDELRHLAPDMAAAHAWLERNRYSNARCEIVPDHEPLPSRPTTL